MYFGEKKNYLCNADIPNPWNTRDAFMEGMFGLTADQMHATNIYAVYIL